MKCQPLTGLAQKKAKGKVSAIRNFYDIFCKCKVRKQSYDRKQHINFPVPQHGIRYARLDGSQTLQQRDAALQEFSGDPAVRCFLVSLKAGGSGLNLVAATRAVLLEPWWNPSARGAVVCACSHCCRTIVQFVAASFGAGLPPCSPVDDQAIQHIHRIGQTSNVKVFRLFAPPRQTSFSVYRQKVFCAPKKFVSFVRHRKKFCVCVSPNKNLCINYVSPKRILCITTKL